MDSDARAVLSGEELAGINRLKREVAAFQHPSRGNQTPGRIGEHELGIPHRTASQWIIDARKAGRLDGMKYNAGRPAGA